MAVKPPMFISVNNECPRLWAESAQTVDYGIAQIVLS